ncbi:MAG: succinate dehydrogenase iron-sulfur subunit [Verrucomicrobia bacterium]|nr:succinate dehydrogenase iron-sulfur subunit [Verrucomicrobiota bacterium]
MEKFRLKILRGTPGKQYWETFELQLRPGLNIIAALMEIRRSPVNTKGEKVAPVVWEDGCLEEVCGSCSMLVNGRPRQACSALIRDQIALTSNHEITLAPFTKFPLIRDLMVDRTSMFESLKKVQGWIETDGTFDAGPGPKISPKKQEVMYELATCMTCGCCLEACPQVNAHSKFMGAAPISQVRLFNAHPTGAMQRKERLRSMMGEEGINHCGNAQNCQKVCPKEIKLLDSIAAIGRDVTLEAFRELFSFPDRDI